MHDLWRILVEYGPAFASGVGVTLLLSGIVWSAGLVGGAALGWAGHKLPVLVGGALWSLSFLAASIPVIVTLFWVHYPLQALLGLVIDPFITAALVLSLVNVLAVAVIVRNALDKFPRQFLAAATVCGLTSKQTFRSILLPLVLRQVSPTLLTSQVVMLQSTLFASMISVEEILRMAQRVNAAEYKPVPIYTALALFFVAICVPLNGLALVLQRRFGRDFSER